MGPGHQRGAYLGLAGAWDTQRISNSSVQPLSRRRAELDRRIGEMSVKRVSTIRVGEVIEALTEIKPSPSPTSRVLHTLLNALQSKSPVSQRQRRVKHEAENVLDFVPKAQQEAVKP